ncbi:hypothetical protein SRHO_G00199830 [Serrasalmus rhombeus]
MTEIPVSASSSYSRAVAVVFSWNGRTSRWCAISCHNTTQPVWLLRRLILLLTHWAQPRAAPTSSARGGGKEGGKGVSSPLYQDAAKWGSGVTRHEQGDMVYWKAVSPAGRGRDWVKLPTVWR